MIKFQCHTFFPSEFIKQNLIDEVIRFIFDHGKKEGKAEIQKFEYLESKKGFLDEIQSIFHYYLRAIIW